MNSESERIRTALLDLLAREGALSAGAIATLLQRAGYRSSQSLWPLLDQLVLEGEIFGEGPPARRIWRLANAPRRVQELPELPELEDPATFLDLPEPPAPIKPVVKTAPGAPVTPAASPKPGAPVTPAASPKPVAPPKPAASPKPTAPPKPTASPKPAAPVTPAASPEPAAPVTPAASPQPGAPSRRRAGRPHGVARTAEYKNITRCDYAYKGMIGYMVRVVWQGRRYQKFFSDKKYGGQDTALEAALAWRNATEQQLGKPRSEQFVSGRPGSNTGVLGVTRVMRSGHPVLEVTWVENGRQRRTSISIDKHGEHKALAMAKAIREQGERRRLELAAQTKKRTKE